MILSTRYDRPSQPQKAIVRSDNLFVNQIMPIIYDHLNLRAFQTHLYGYLMKVRKIGQIYILV